MKDTVNHIFESGACLSQTQLQAYVEQKLGPSEQYLVEKHLSNCALCSDAVEGVQWALENGQHWDVKPLPSALFVEREKTPINPTATTKNVRLPQPFDTRRIAAAAALLVLMLGVGYGVYYFGKPKETEWVQTQVETELPITVQTNKDLSDLDTTRWKDDMGLPKLAEPIAEKSAPTSTMPPPQEALRLPNGPVTQAAERASHSDKKMDNQVAKSAAPTRAQKNIYPAASSGNLSNQKSNENDNHSYAEDINQGQKEEMVEVTSRQKSIEKKKEVTDQLTKGILYYNSGQYEDALKMFRPILQSPSSADYAEATYYTALTYLRMDQSEMAKKLLQQLVETRNPFTRKAKRMLKDIK